MTDQNAARQLPTMLLLAAALAAAGGGCGGNGKPGEDGDGDPDTMFDPAGDGDTGLDQDVPAEPGPEVELDSAGDPDVLDPQDTEASDELPGFCGVERRLFYDSFEEGLALWSFGGSNHEQSADQAHSGGFSHKVWDVGDLSEIAYVVFDPPASGSLYVGFWWLVEGSYGDSPGKLGRLISAGQTNQMEMWCSSGSWSPGIHWYGSADEGCSIDPDGLCCRYPGVNQEAPGVWHRNEIFIEYNREGESNGRFRQWIDRPESIPLSEADAYKTADEADTRFFGPGACALPYNSLRLPTNIDGGFMGGFIYYDDVDIRDCLPDGDG